MNRRVLLAIASVAVLAAALVLYFKLRTDPAAATNSPRATIPTDPTVPTPPPAGTSPRGRASAPVVTTGSTERETPTGDGSAKEVTINGVKIRDHRSGNRPPIDLPPNIHAPDSRKVSPTLTADFSEKLQAVMSECAASVPTEARGLKPRLEGTILIAIKDHQARITQSTMQLRDVEGASVAPTKQCIEEKSLGLTTHAGDERDLENYSISITFALR